MKRNYSAMIMTMLATTGLFADELPSREQLQKIGAKTTPATGAIDRIQVDASRWTQTEFELLARYTPLKKLTINGKTLNDSTLPLLAKLVNLEELSTNATNMSDAGYKHFAGFNKLRTLALFHPSWGNKDFTGRGLIYLKPLKNLESLTYAGCSTGDEALAAIGELTQLQSFRTWHTFQTQAGNEHLINLKKLTSLKLGQRLPQRGQASPPSLDGSTILTLVKMPTLQKLELSEARLSLEELAPLAILSGLKELKIHTTDFPPTDVPKLKELLLDVKVNFQPLTEEQKEQALKKKLKLYE